MSNILVKIHSWWLTLANKYKYKPKTLLINEKLIIF